MLEISLFIIAAFIGFIPSIFKMKQEGTNWWRALNLAGKAYVVLFIIFLFGGIFLIRQEQLDDTRKEKRLSDEGIRDSISIVNLDQKIDRLTRYDSTIKLALSKGGYKYDSIKGVIVAPQIYISGDFNNAKSNNQSGGITAGKIENLTVTGEEANNINSFDNFIIETKDDLIFRVRPKVGKWLKPCVFIPKAEYGSCPYQFNSASGMTLMRVDDHEIVNNSTGELYMGSICGFDGAISNPATKDYYYIIEFTKKRPSKFFFGDFASDIKFENRAIK